MGAPAFEAAVIPDRDLEQEAPQDSDRARSKPRFRRAVVLRLLGFACLYPGLMAIWPWVANAFRALLVFACNPVVAILPLGASVSLPIRAVDPPGVLRIRVEFTDMIVATPTDTFVLGYLTTAAFVALWIVTPQGGWLRIKTLFLGLGLSMGLSVVRIALLAIKVQFKHVELCSNPLAHAEFPRERWIYRIVTRMDSWLTSDPAVFIASGLVIWFVLCFRLDDWRDRARRGSVVS